MKKDLHPQEYRPVVYQDTNSGFTYLTKSTAKTDETIKWEDGKEYPLFKVHISSASHPFYTGEEKIVDVEGRVDRFKARQAAATASKDRLANKANKAIKKSAKKAAKAEAETKAEVKPKTKPVTKPAKAKSEAKPEATAKTEAKPAKDS